MHVWQTSILNAADIAVVLQLLCNTTLVLALAKLFWDKDLPPFALTQTWSKRVWYPLGTSWYFSSALSKLHQALCGSVWPWDKGH